MWIQFQGSCYVQRNKIIKMNSRPREHLCAHEQICIRINLRELIVRVGTPSDPNSESLVLSDMNMNNLLTKKMRTATVLGDKNK